MKIITIQPHPLMVSSHFENILSSLDLTNGVIKDNEALIIKGWVVLKKKSGSINILIEEKDKSYIYPLNVDRPDVQKKLRSQFNINTVIKSGFHFSVNIKHNFSLFIEIDGKKIAWKKISISHTEHDFLSIFKELFSKRDSMRNENLLKLNLLSDKQIINLVDSYSSQLKIIEAKQIAINAQLQKIQKIYLADFIRILTAPNILSKMIYSIKTENTIKLPSPFGPGESYLTYSFIDKNVNYLRFSTTTEDFYIIQFLHTIDGVFFPKHNLIIRPTNSHFDFQHTKNLISYLLTNIKSNGQDFLKDRTMKFQGLLLNGISPYHFYYDCLPAIQILYNLELLKNNITTVYSLNGASYFPLKLLYGIPHEEVNITSQELSKKLSEKNGFVLLGGSSYKNISLNQINLLDKRLIKKSISLGTNEFNETSKLITDSSFVIWIGISSQKRAWVNQNESLIKLINKMTEKINNLIIVFDGMTASIFDSEDNNNETISDLKTVEEISSSLEQKVPIINLINKKSYEKIFYASKIDMFIANYSTGSMYPSRMLKKPGITHLSNTMYDIIKDIHIHHDNLSLIPSDIINDIPHENNRVDFVSYTINEDKFITHVLNYTENLIKAKNIGLKMLDKDVDYL